MCPDCGRKYVDGVLVGAPTATESEETEQEPQEPVVVEKPPQGRRPIIPGQKMRAHTITLPDAMLTFAKRLGGGNLSDADIIDATVSLLLPQTTVLTPNSHEARLLATEADSLDACAQELLEMKTKAGENNQNAEKRIDELIGTLEKGVENLKP